MNINQTGISYNWDTVNTLVSYNSASNKIKLILEKPMIVAQVPFLKWDEKARQLLVRTKIFTTKLTESTGNPFIKSPNTYSTYSKPYDQKQENYLYEGSEQEYVLSYEEYSFVHTETFGLTIEQGQNLRNILPYITKRMAEESWLADKELEIIINELSSGALDFKQIGASGISTITESDLDSQAESPDHDFEFDTWWKFISENYNDGTIRKDVVDLSKLNADYPISNNLLVNGTHFKTSSVISNPTDDTAWTNEDISAFTITDLSGAWELAKDLNANINNFKTQKLSAAKGFTFSNEPANFVSKSISNDIYSLETVLNTYKSDYDITNFDKPGKAGEIPLIISTFSTYNKIVQSEKFISNALTVLQAPYKVFNDMFLGKAQILNIYGIQVLFLNEILGPFYSNSKKFMDPLSTSGVEHDITMKIRPGKAFRIVPEIGLDETNGEMNSLRADSASAIYQTEPQLDINKFEDVIPNNRHPYYKNPQIMILYRVGYKLFDLPNEIYDILVYNRK